MLQLKNKNKVYFYILSFVFLSTIVNNNFSINIDKFFLIKNIYIDIDEEENKNLIKSQTNFLLNSNIFKIDRKAIVKKISNLNFLEKIEIYKDYPSQIIIKAKETEIIAVTYLDQKKYFVGLNGKFISEKKLNNIEKLPIIFGKFKINDFISFREKLNQNKVNNSKISKYYFHKNKRWDLYFNNNILLKLPEKNIDNALSLFKYFQKNNKIKRNTIVDLRIANRVILNYE